tara:strand:- start:461 stop:715 length:255 start_codon:yes stop_codon:yes gene_type:complete
MTSMILFFSRETCDDLGIPFCGKKEIIYKISVQDLLKKVRRCCASNLLEPFCDYTVTICKYAHIAEGGYQIVGFFDTKSSETGR